MAPPKFYSSSAPALTWNLTRFETLAMIVWYYVLEKHFTQKFKLIGKGPLRRRVVCKVPGRNPSLCMPCEDSPALSAWNPRSQRATCPCRWWEVVVTNWCCMRTEGLDRGEGIAVELQSAALSPALEHKEPPENSPALLVLAPLTRWLIFLNF